MSDHDWNEFFRLLSQIVHMHDKTKEQIAEEVTSAASDWDRVDELTELIDLLTEEKARW